MGDMVVTLIDGEGIRVERADRRIAVSGALLARPDPRFLDYTDGILTVTASNGVWRYRHSSYDEATDVHSFVIV